MNLYMAGIDFQHADIATRESVTLTAHQVQDFLIKMKSFVSGCVILATCNRTELYVHTQQPIDNFLHFFTTHLNLNLQQYQPYIVVRHNEQAILHLFQVASGMQSQIFGDDQILSQVRNAIQISRDLKCTDGVLDTLFRYAITAGKRVKTETKLINVTASAAHLGIEWAQTFFGDLKGKRALVIGNGEIGRLSASLLHQAECDVTITLRSYRHGNTIVPAGCKTYPYEERYTILNGMDLVVSATASPHHTIVYEQVQSCPQIPCLFLDLAMPRDIDIQIKQCARVIHLDDLAHKSNENAGERQKAEQILQQELTEFYAWYEYRKALPLIVQMKDIAVQRVRFDPEFSTRYAEKDLDGLTELAVYKTIDMILGGLKESFTASQIQSCLAKMQKGHQK